MKTWEFALAYAARLAIAVSRVSGLVKTRVALLLVRMVRGQLLGAPHAAHAAP